MSKLHVLTTDRNGRYTIIAHIDTPAGNNSAGKEYKSVLLASNLTGSKAHVRPDDSDPGVSVYGPSVLETGVGSHAWLVSSAEAAELTAGDKIEIRFDILQRQGMSVNALDTLAQKRIDEWLVEKQTEYKYFGLLRD
jgi:hypothetical protein